MKNMNNFAAQQLSKSQMNQISGGKKFECYVDGQWIGITIGAATREDAEQYVESLYGEADCREV